MKALTVKQPWASLIVQGFKDIENRTWKIQYRGKILIHAALLHDKCEWDALTKEQRLELPCEIPCQKLPKGAILGSVEIVDCIKNHPSVWAEKGMWNWVLDNAILFPKPIPAKGKLSLWDYPNIHSEQDEDGSQVCICNIPVDEEVQVMNLIDTFRCKYCGGKWYK